jgi:hypothetical protein
MPVRLGLLGGFRVTIEAEEVPLPMNAQRLVGFLAIHNQPLLRTFVGGSLWGDSDDDKAGGSLRSALWRLRRATYPMVSLTSDHIELSPVVAVDLHEGEALAQRVLDPTQESPGVTGHWSGDVHRLAYEVEAARVGQRTDYDKLVLDVTTDGSIEPKEAIAQAAEILIRQLAIFTDIDKIEGFGEAAVEAAAEATTSHGMENFPIEELELGVRSYNCLKRVGIETIGDLTSKSEAELAAIPNFGKKSVEEVRETLAAHGLTLKGEELV